MTAPTPQGELHPGAAARAVRALRGLRHLRGWGSLANRIAGPAGAFRVTNDGVWIELGGGTRIAPDEAAQIVALVPERAHFYRIAGVRHGATHGIALHESAPDALMDGDYVIVPEPA